MRPIITAMKRSGHADLPLHGGRVPRWLSARMSRLGRAIVEAIVAEHGKAAVLARLSDPLWFQSLGCAVGMDWHSSGITTAVMGALKRAVNPISRDLGIYICGGKGRQSRRTPDEIRAVAGATGVPGERLVRCSRLSAKIDNTAVQDGFQIYLHSFILTDEGDWAVIQQGMNEAGGLARRYHWHAAAVRSFVEDPHTAVCGRNRGIIVNLADRRAGPARGGILSIAAERPDRVLAEARKIGLPARHEILGRDVDIRRLGTVLTAAHENRFRDFPSLLLLRGLGPRTLRSLTLISEIIHGAPARFRDPARFSFAHGGKDRHPFPVQTAVYDESVRFLAGAVRRAKIGRTERKEALENLHRAQVRLERQFVPDPAGYDAFIEDERAVSHRYGGRSAFGREKPPGDTGPRQLRLF